MSGCTTCPSNNTNYSPHLFKATSDGCGVQPVINNCPPTNATCYPQTTNSYQVIELPEDYCRTPLSDQVPYKKANKSWLDIGIFEDYMFGFRVVNEIEGTTVLSSIPQWAIDWCLQVTPTNSPGRLLNDCFQIKGRCGTYKRYIKTKSNGDAQIYVKEIETGEELTEGEFNALIPNCAIKDLDASKLFNVCSIVQRVAKPIGDFYNQSTGVLPAATSVLPIVYSNGVNNDCRLSTLFDCKVARACVIPSLTSNKGRLWDYNPDIDTAPLFIPQNLDCLIDVCVDGETIRPAERSGTGLAGTTKGGAGDRPNGKILTSFTYVTPDYLQGDGTRSRPIDIKDNSLDANVIKRCDNLNPNFIDYTNFYFGGSWAFTNGGITWTLGGGVGGLYNMSVSGSDSITVNSDFDGGTSSVRNPSVSGTKSFSFTVPSTGCSGKNWLANVSFQYRQLGLTRANAEVNNYRAGLDNLINMRPITDNRDKITLYADFNSRFASGIDGTGNSGGASILMEIVSGAGVGGRMFNECVFPNGFSDSIINQRDFLGFCVLNVHLVGVINKNILK